MWQTKPTPRQEQPSDPRQSCITFDKKVSAALAKGSLGAHVFEQLQGRPSCVLKKCCSLQRGCKVITPKNPQEEWCCFCVFWVLKGFVVVQRVDVWGMLS